MPRYTDEFRATCVIMAQAEGYPERMGALSRAARKCGVSHQTLGRWVRAEYNPPPRKTVQVKKEAIIENIKAELWAIFGDMIDARQDANYRELGTVFGILTDKMQLLTGEPTGIINWRRAMDDIPGAASEEFEAMVKEMQKVIPDGTG